MVHTIINTITGLTGVNGSRLTINNIDVQQNRFLHTYLANITQSSSR